MSDMITWPEPEKGLRLVVCALLMWGDWLRSGESTSLDYPGFTMEHKMMMEQAGASHKGKSAPVIHRNPFCELVDKLIAGMSYRAKWLLVQKYAWNRSDTSIRTKGVPDENGKKRSVEWHIIRAWLTEAESQLEAILEDL